MNDRSAEIILNKLDNLNQDMQLLKSDVRDLKTDVSSLKADVSDLKTTTSKLEANVSTSQNEVSGIKTDLRRLEILHEETNSKINHIIELVVQTQNELSQPSST